MKIEKIIIATALLLCSYVNAQMVTDRPDQSESSATVGNGNLQIETGILAEKNHFVAPTTLFRYGIGEKFELRFVNELEIAKGGGDTQIGITDLQIGAKWQLFSDNGTEVALLSHAVLPTGSNQPENSEAFGVINKICVGHEISDKLGLGWNIGYDYFNGDDKGNLTYSLVLGVTVNDKVAIYVEPYGELVNFDEHLAKFDAGFTFLAKENLQYDVSFGTGLNHRANYISIGCSWLATSKSAKKELTE